VKVGKQSPEKKVVAVITTLHYKSKSLHADSCGGIIEVMGEMS